MADRIPELPVLKQCAGACGTWIRVAAVDADGQAIPAEGAVVGQVELGTNMGIYAEVRMCDPCASKFNAARSKPAVEIKSKKA